MVPVSSPWISATKRLSLAAALLFAVTSSTTAQFISAVDVESKTAVKNTSVTVGIYISNGIDLGGFQIPLSIRSASGGAYITAASAQFNSTSGARLHPVTGQLKSTRIITTFPDDDGSCGGSAMPGFATPGPLDFVSPDALLYFALASTGDNLPAGTDHSVLDESGRKIPSLLLELTLNDSPGFIDIDTTCVQPGGTHLAFSDVTGNIYFTPGFTRGTISVIDQDLIGWWPHCGCPNWELDSINSPFGPRRFDNGTYDFHRGMDIKNAHGEDVHAILSGNVERSVLDDGYGYQVNVDCTGLDASGQEGRVRTVYMHLEETPPPPYVGGEPIGRGSVVHQTGDPPNVAPHIHVATRPDLNDNRRAHPARYLTRDESWCPTFDPTFDPSSIDKRYTLEGSEGSYTRLLCRSRSDRDQRYDLIAVYARIYSPFLERFEVARMHFEEDYSWFSPSPSVSRSSRLFFTGTDHEVRITLDPRPMNRGDDYHLINITVDPTATFENLQWLGVWLQDIGTGNCSDEMHCRPPLSTDFCPSIGNVWGDSPGTPIDFFTGVRTPEGVHLGWRGAPGCEAYGVRIYRSLSGAPPQPLDTQILPLSVFGRADTIHFLDTEISDEMSAGYRLGIVYPNGTVILAGDELVMGTEADLSEVESVPRDFTLNQNYPNPFNSSTTIRFTISQQAGASVNLRVIDVLGRRVVTLFSSEQVEPGPYTLIWNGQDDHGQSVSSGVYFYTLKTGAGSTTKKMVVLE